MTTTAKCHQVSRAALSLLLSVIWCGSICFGQPPTTIRARPDSELRRVHEWWYSCAGEPSDNEVDSVLAWADSSPDDAEGVFLAWAAAHAKLGTRKLTAEEVDALLEGAANKQYVPAVAVRTMQTAEKARNTGGPDAAARALRGLKDDGSPDAAYALGIGGTLTATSRDDLARATDILIDAADRGMVRAWTWVAMCEARMAQFDRAKEFIQKGVDHGDPQAIGLMGAWYLDGYNLLRDEKAGFELLERASKFRTANGKFDRRLAECLEKGTGTTRDLPRAFDHYLRAAQGDDYVSKVWVATALVLGRGVERDVDQGLKLLTQLSEVGDAAASRQLGVFYLEGLVTKRDIDRARQLFGAAAKAGDESAAEYLEQLDVAKQR